MKDKEKRYNYILETAENKFKVALTKDQIVLLEKLFDIGAFDEYFDYYNADGEYIPVWCGDPVLRNLRLGLIMP